MCSTTKNVFDYKEPHFDVRLRCISDDKPMPDVESKLNDLNGMVFEIQLRTICQHAWIAISRNLFYGKENNIAKDIERDFYAINGLFYVADTHFEMIKENNKPGINAGTKHILP